MSLQVRTIVIIAVLSIASLFIWPNIAIRTLDVHFRSSLSQSEQNKYINKLFKYLETNYAGRYTWEKVEYKPTTEWADSDVNIEDIIKKGISKQNQRIQNGIRVRGYFMQTTFVNTISQQDGVDSNTTQIQPTWIESRLKAKPFKLGLDLQGGMNIILEADFNKLKEQLSIQYDEDYLHKLQKEIDSEKDKTKKDVLIAKRYDILQLLSFSPERKKEYVRGALEIIRSRIDRTGVSEPLIRLQGDDKIEVSLPGVSSPEKAKTLLKSTAQVSYHLVEPQPLTYTQNAMQYFPQYISLKSLEDKKSYLKDIAKKIELPKKYSIFVVWNRDKTNIKEPLIESSFLTLEKQASLSGKHITPNTYVSFRSDTLQQTINFQLTNKGTKIFANLTKNNVGRQMAIIIDDKIRSAPAINEAILTGSAQISGDFTAQEAKDLSLIIKEGALPVPMNIVHENTVGPILGQESIEQGLFSIWVGLLAVSIFMILYYQVAGLIANIALIFNVIIMLGILALMNFTITLPGLAGMVLTMGMAVDANVIIYERIREELRDGKGLKIAVSHGFSRATLTIIDSNLTTILAAIVLSQFGSGPIKGFAVTLFIGIVSSLFTSLYITKTMIYMLVYKIGITHIPIGLYFSKTKKEVSA